MLLLLLACAPQLAPDIVKGPEGDQENDPNETAEPDDTGLPQDTGDTGDGPQPSTDEACYPGADESWTTCLPLVDYSTGWGEDYAYPEPLNGSALYRKPVRFVDLTQVDPTTMLAPNFRLDELMQEYKGRYAIAQPHAVERIQEVRDAVGGPVTVNSAYRNVTYNAGVGGATHSRHLYGDSFDIRSSAASLDALADHCQALGAGYIGWYESHIHCDWRDDPMSEAFFGPPGPPPQERSGCTDEDGPPLKEWFRG